MVNIKIARLWRGFASVRSNLVQKALQAKEPLVIQFNKEIMTIQPEDIEKRSRHFNPKTFSSKYGKLEYYLVDFYFRKDEEGREVNG